VSLRPYQIDAIERVRVLMRQGFKRVLLVMPTGAGKTRTCAEMSRIVVARGGRVLWLAHRAELIDQAADTLTAQGLTVGSICATATTPPNPFASVQVASPQTLVRRELPPADLIVADEAHHFADAAESWSALLAKYPTTPIVGPTATPDRGDGCGLRGSFDAIAVGATVAQLTEMGHLVPCRIHRPDKYLEPGQIAQNPVDAYVEHAQGRRTIVFCRSVALAEEYAQEFVLRGIPARALSAETPWAERRLYLDAFKRGAIQVLLNVYVLTEGFDDPGVSCCILARGCGSAGMYLQMIGRILRPAEGKTDALLIDLRGVSHEHGRPEDERTYELEGRGIRIKDPNVYCPVCGVAREPGEGCTSCGWVPSGDDTSKPDKVTGDPIKPWISHMRESDDAARRAMRLAKWLGEGRARGFKPGWAKFKFKSVYGGWPPAAVLAEATRLLAAEVETVPEPGPVTAGPEPAPQIDVREWMASRPHTAECRCKDCRATREGAAS
jgi:superfamily II DNA or RNA helicase